MTEDGGKRKGLSSMLVVTCQECAHEENTYTSKKVSGGAMDINRRIVLAMRLIGKGLQPLEQFCGVLNMPGSMEVKTYTGHVTALRKAAKEEAEKSMTKAVNDIRHLYEVNPNGIVDIGVSGDGTWRKRGFSSFHGVATAISIVSGKVVDIEIKSSYCRACALWEKKKGTPEYRQWEEKHGPKCHKNYSGSSGAMEVSAIADIFQRSVATRAARYTEYLGDGDSKAVKLVNEQQPYGPDLVVKKLECINHVSKRMYARLDSVKQQYEGKKLADKKGMDGKGRLTVAIMKELQGYYGRAIRQNQDSIQDMKKAIWASYYHRISTDDHPQHQYCPDGPDGWCKYNNDPTSYEHHDVIPAAIAPLIKPCYEELTADTLLSKCTHGGTSNANEGFNSILWRIAPKSEFSGTPTLELSSYLAVLSFNDGATGVLRTLEGAGVRVVGRHTVLAVKKKDTRRINIMEYRQRASFRRRRYILKKARKRIQHKEATKEGLTYGAGQF
ncbi:uncharacterized protein LOC134188136 [Corticium candelabrum]|uniref:uncharacterized protein LOC134188136 n=1 Tax=Corticium candelabrum TaxID=121492 RepID=UPI002E262A5C|nr:uncharacterized protein LOC134188136 [Corticium candelabrum]